MKHTRGNNLIYTICNDRYSKLLDLMVLSIRKHSDIGVCCIAPCGFRSNDKGDNDKNNVYMFHIPDFDYMYKSKYVINKWSEFHKFDNFLYLDTDILCNGKIDVLFDIIDSQPNFLHGVIEKKSLNDAGDYHKFSNTIYDNTIPAYNAGTFGFNRAISNQFDDFILYIEKNKAIATCEQPLFNEFFTDKNILHSSFSPYVYFDNDIYKDVRPVNVSNVIFRHYLGSYGNATLKINKMRYDFERGF